MSSRRNEFDARRRSGPPEEPILPLPCARHEVPPVTEFRSTWLASSILGLRAGGHFEQYLSALDPSHKSAILNCVAGSWLPMATVRAHYQACETLDLHEDDLLSMALAGGDIRRTWHASVIGAAKRDDSTPWTVFPTLHKVWLRGANGGACAVYRNGERQVRVEYVGCELFDFSYFRHAARAVLVIFFGHTCEKLDVITVPHAEPGEVSYILRWMHERYSP